MQTLRLAVRIASLVAVAIAVSPLVTAPPAARAAIGWSGPIGLPAGIDATSLPIPVVDPLGNFMLQIPTATGLKIAEFASDGSLQPAVGMRAFAPTRSQPTAVVDTKFLPSGDAVLLVDGTMTGPLGGEGATSFVAYRFADGHFAGPPVSLAGVTYTALAVRPGEALVSVAGVVRTIAIGVDGSLVPGAKDTLVPALSGQFGVGGLALDPDGAAVAFVNVGNQIQQAVRSTSGTWSATTPYYDPPAIAGFHTTGMFAVSTASGRLAAAFTRESAATREYLVFTREPGGLPAAPVTFLSRTLLAGEDFSDTQGLQCFRGEDGSIGVVTNMEICAGTDYSTANFSAGVFRAIDPIVPAGVTTLPGDAWADGHQRVFVPMTTFGPGDPGDVAVRGGRIVVVQTKHVLAGDITCGGPNAFTSETDTLQAVSGEAGVDLASYSLAQWVNPGVTGNHYDVDEGHARSAVDDQGNAVVVAHEVPFDGSPGRMVYFAFGVPGAEHGGPPKSQGAGYCLPTKVKATANAKRPEKSSLTASGVLDFGTGFADLSGAATFDVGGFHLAVPAFVAKGKTLTYSAGEITLTITPAKNGSSHATFSVKAVGDLTGKVDLNGSLAFHFANAAHDVAGAANLLKGALGPHAVTAPDLSVAKAAATIKGAGKDALNLTLGFASDGVVPAAAEDLSIQFGGTFTATLAGGWVKKGNAYVHTAKAPGITKATIDYAKGTITIVGAKLDLGAFVAGGNAVVVTATRGSDARSASIRMARAGTKLTY